MATNPDGAHDAARDGAARPDLTRRALDAARAAARNPAGERAGRAGIPGGTGGRRAGGFGPGVRAPRRRRGWTGPGPDRWDPQPLSRLVAEAAKSRGWRLHLADGAVIGRWEEIVGPEIAAHARPDRIEDTVLHITASSTAWATNLRLMQTQILRTIAAAVGRGVVTRLRILGPQPPSWRKGPRHVSGRGPRDTYG